MWVQLFLTLSVISNVKSFIILSSPGEKVPCSRNDWTMEPINCVIDSSKWKGAQNLTIHGLECQPWVADFPHSHDNHDDGLFPDVNQVDAGNKCRDPDGKGYPWCYTSNPDYEWQTCGIPECLGDVNVEPDICTQCLCSLESSYINIEVECEPIVCPECPGRLAEDGSCCGACDMSVCVVNGVEYEDGEELPSEDPCHSCVCVADGEQVGQACVSASCPVCHGVREDDGTCCGECMPGCMINETFYEDEEEFQDGCNKCKCTVSDHGPLISCVGAACALNCNQRMTQINEGDCCPTCLPGCFDEVMGAVYDIDEEIPRVSPCETCHCREDESGISHVECVKEECLPCDGEVESDGSCCGICRVDGCFYNGVKYNDKDDVPQKDPCKMCSCYNDGSVSELVCAVMDCPPCQGRITKDDTCCGVCEVGCFDNDQFFPDGEVIPSEDPCTSKSCEGGEIAQVSMMCEPCVGRWTSDETCCGKCEFGCFLDEAFYEDGADFSLGDPCHQGYCHLGQVIVSTMMCEECHGQWTDDGTCCGKCEPGCLVDGEIYSDGANVPMSDPCSSAMCSNGEVMIMMMGCAPCAGTPVSDGTCCGQCISTTTLGAPVIVEETTMVILPILETTTSDGCDPSQCPKLACPKNLQYQDEGMCCPQCRCKKKRKHFLPGPVGDKCDGCVCDGNTGKISCTPPTCSDVIECVDPEIGEDCCYSCPNGKTCLMKGNKNRGIVLKYGEYHRTRKLVCTCGGDPWYPYAFCADVKLPKKIFKNYMDYFDKSIFQLGKN